MPRAAGSARDGAAPADTITSDARSPLAIAYLGFIGTWSSLVIAVLYMLVLFPGLPVPYPALLHHIRHPFGNPLAYTDALPIVIAPTTIPVAILAVFWNNPLARLACTLYAASVCASATIILGVLDPHGAIILFTAIPLYLVSVIGVLGSGLACRNCLDRSNHTAFGVLGIAIGLMCTMMLYAKTSLSGSSGALGFPLAAILTSGPRGSGQIMWATLLIDVSIWAAVGVLAGWWLNSIVKTRNSKSAVLPLSPT